MKILIVSNSSGGLYRFRKDIIKNLIDEKHEVICVTNPDKFTQELKDLRMKIIEIAVDRRGKNIMNEFSLFLKYRKVIKEEQPDKIITYTIKPNIYCGIINRSYKKEFYPNITGLGTTFQGEGLFKKLICSSYRMSFKNAKKVFFENKYNNEVFITEKICDVKNSVVLNGAGVNLEEFKFEPLPNFETINFIFMGRIMKEKGIEELFYAIREIKKKYSNVNFMILGSLEENYKKELEQMEKKGLLKYYGVQKDVKKYIKQAHCCILPSYHEGMSNTLLECGAMGRALITSNIPGCKEAVLNEKTGFLHQVRISESLLEKIDNYINMSIKEKIKMGKESRSYIEKTFDKRDVVLKTVKEFK